MAADEPCQVHHIVGSLTVGLANLALFIFFVVVEVEGGVIRSVFIEKFGDAGILMAHAVHFFFLRLNLDDKFE
jgi:hypothetical protein